MVADRLRAAIVHVVKWLDELRQDRPCRRCGGRAVKSKLTNGASIFQCRDCELVHFHNGTAFEPKQVANHERN